MRMEVTFGIKVKLPEENEVSKGVGYIPKVTPPSLIRELKYMIEKTKLQRI